MRGPHGCRLFASLEWPRHTGCSLEAIDIKYARELLAEDTVGLCVTNLRLWEHRLSVTPETSSMEGGARFHLDTSHHRPGPLVTRCDRITPQGVRGRCDYRADHPARAVDQPSAPCPLCATPAWRIHSDYGRTLADLPWAQYRVRLQLRVRKWFCRNRACGRRIFTERLPTIAAPWARRTCGRPTPGGARHRVGRASRSAPRPCVRPHGARVPQQSHGAPAPGYSPRDCTPRRARSSSSWAARPLTPIAPSTAPLWGCRITTAPCAATRFGLPISLTLRPWLLSRSA